MRRCLHERGVCDASGARLALEGPGCSALVGRVCDAEPLFETELALGRAVPQRLIQGLGALGMLCAARRLVLASSNEGDLARRLVDGTRGTRVEVIPLVPAWPLDAGSLVCDLAGAMGCSVAAAGLERSTVVDAVVLHDVALALEGRSVLRRHVTVAGAVGEPAVLIVPLGTAMSDLVAACGGSPDAGWVPWRNGVLGGERVDWGDVVDLDTRGLVVLPHDHGLVRRATTPVADELRRALSACVNCRVCTEACPIQLNGGELRPHLVMLGVAASWQASTLAADGATLAVLECLECDLCSVLCPSTLRPGVVMRELARRLRQRGVELAARHPLRPHPRRGGRRLARARLVEMLGLVRHAGRGSLRRRELVPDRVSLPLEGPWGRWTPTVREGERVAAGDVVALAAAASRAVDRRAPASGTVTAVDPDDGIVIAVR